MLRPVSNATLPAVEICEAHNHVFADDATDKLTIGRMVSAATAMVEAETARQFIEADWTLTLDCFSQVIELRICPVKSVTSVKYYDTDGVQQTLDPSAYLVDVASEPGRIVPAPGTSWPAAQCRPNAVEVLFTAGYGDSTGNVPQAAQQAVLLLAGHWFSNREAVGNVGGEIALAYRSLINSLRWTW